MAIRIRLHAQLCPSLGDLMVCSPPGPSVHVIFQTVILSALPILPPGDFPHPGNELMSAILLLHLLHFRQILYH